MAADAVAANSTGKPVGASWTTDAVPAHLRAVHWSDTLARAFPGTEVTVPGDGCRGSIRTSLLGPVQVVTVAGGPMELFRSAPTAASRHGGSLMVMSLLAGEAVVGQGARETPVRAGESVFCDTARPLRIAFPGPYRVACLVFPRGLIGLSETHLRRVLATPISGCGPSAALLSPLLAGLGDTLPKLPPGTGEVLVRHVVGLLSVLAEEPLPDTDRGARPAPDLLARITSYIDGRLGDPDLTLESIAKAHHISVRYLHKLFESEDTTARRWIQRRRLERCRRELGRPGSAALTISAVARRCGFSSAPHFSRAFRRRYGMSPAEWRERALGADGPAAAA